MENVIIALLILIIIVLAAGVWVLYNKLAAIEVKEISVKVDDFNKSLTKIEGQLKEEFRVNREESLAVARDNRLELRNELTAFSGILTNFSAQNREVIEHLNTTTIANFEKLTKKLEDNLVESRKELSQTISKFSDNSQKQLDQIDSKLQTSLKELQEGYHKESLSQRELFTNFYRGLTETMNKNNKEFQAEFEKNVANLNSSQREKMSDLTLKQEQLIDKTEKKLEGLRITLSDSLNLSIKEFQAAVDKSMTDKFKVFEEKQDKLVDNTEKKLEEMRATVDEKLTKTLNERLGQSFETVSKQLLAVENGLGEMKTLATDVGGLKNALSNIKMRGSIGEIQLEMLLEQILAPGQYQKNVKTKEKSNDLVEFAIKLPGRETDKNSFIWLPIDAKFPKDIYEQLQEAYQLGDITKIEIAQKTLEQTIKKMAKDISDKYIDPPHTTDFAIMFLPFEGIFAEVTRRASLMEDLYKNHRIVVTGPTTLAAILNSFHVGFRTLAIEKRSSEVWKILGAVKKEFESFGGLLDKAHKGIATAGEAIDQLKGTRTNAIARKLRDVETLSIAESASIFPEIAAGDLLDGDE